MNVKVIISTAHVVTYPTPRTPTCLGGEQLWTRPPGSPLQQGPGVLNGLPGGCSAGRGGRAGVGQHLNVLDKNLGKVGSSGKKN